MTCVCSVISTFIVFCLHIFILLSLLLFSAIIVIFFCALLACVRWLAHPAAAERRPTPTTSPLWWWALLCCLPCLGVSGLWYWLERQDNKRHIYRNPYTWQYPQTLYKHIVVSQCIPDNKCCNWNLVRLFALYRQRDDLKWWLIHIKNNWNNHILNVMVIIISSPFNGLISPYLL